MAERKSMARDAQLWVVIVVMGFAACVWAMEFGRETVTEECLAEGGFRHGGVAYTCEVQSDG